MDPILDFSFAVILYLQNLGDWLIAAMKFFTFLGQEDFFLLIMPALYWCVNTSLGLRIGVILLISHGLNEILKMVFHSPRPYFLNIQVRALATETSFAAPSGHAQDAAAVWGLLAAILQRGWAWAIALGLIFLIGSSRVILGVHFPGDVLLGWAVGGLLVWAYLKVEAPILDRLRRQTPIRQVLLVFIVSLVLILSGILARFSLGDWATPAEWLQNVSITAPEGDLPDPLSLDKLVMVAGALFGLAGGAIWLKTRGEFLPQGSWWKRILRIPVGLVGVLLLWFGLGAVFPRGDFALAYGLRYLRYAFVGLWIAALAPLVFARLGLARLEVERGTKESREDAYGMHPSR